MISVEQTILSKLEAAVGRGNVLTAKEDLIPYSFDGTAGLRQMPGCVVFATDSNQVSQVLRLANDQRTSVVTRGSGTG